MQNTIYSGYTEEGHAQSDLCYAGVHIREMIIIFLIYQLFQISVLVEDFNMGIFSDTVNIKLCMMVLLTKLDLSIPLND